MIDTAIYKSIQDCLNFEPGIMAYFDIITCNNRKIPTVFIAATKVLDLPTKSHNPFMYALVPNGQVFVLAPSDPSTHSLSKKKMLWVEIDLNDPMCWKKIRQAILADTDREIAIANGSF